MGAWSAWSWLWRKTTSGKRGLFQAQQWEDYVFGRTEWEKQAWVRGSQSRNSAEFLTRFKRWLPGGAQDLGQPVVVELLLEWLNSFLTLEEQDRLMVGHLGMSIEPMVQTWSINNVKKPRTFFFYVCKDWICWKIQQSLSARTDYLDDIGDLVRTFTPYHADNAPPGIKSCWIANTKTT